MTIGFSDVPFVTTPSSDKAFRYRLTKIHVTPELSLGRCIENLQTTRAEHTSSAFGPM